MITPLRIGDFPHAKLDEFYILERWVKQRTTSPRNEPGKDYRVVEATDVAKIIGYIQRVEKLLPHPDHERTN